MYQKSTNREKISSGILKLKFLHSKRPRAKIKTNRMGEGISSEYK